MLNIIDGHTALEQHIEHPGRVATLAGIGFHNASDGFFGSDASLGEAFSELTEQAILASFDDVDVLEHPNLVAKIDFEAVAPYNSGMDERVEKAMEHAHYAATLAMKRKTLELRYRNDLLYASGGGIFTVTPAMMCFVDLLRRNGNSDAVLIDDKGIPIRIDDLDAFAEKIADTYHRATNAYHADFEKLRKARNVKSIIAK